MDRLLVVCAQLPSNLKTRHVNVAAGRGANLEEYDVRRVSKQLVVAEREWKHQELENRG